MSFEFKKPHFLKSETEKRDEKIEKLENELGTFHFVPAELSPIDDAWELDDHHYDPVDINDEEEVLDGKRRKKEDQQRVVEIRQRLANLREAAEE